MTLTAAQVRQACDLLRWKSAMLARRSGVAYTAAMRAKADDGIAALLPADVRAIRAALGRAGVVLAWDADGRPGAVLMEAQT